MDETTAALVEELKQAIADLEDGSGDQAHVAELAGRIERRLHAEEELHDEDDTLGDDVREGAIKFEADHPKLANALRRIADAFGGLGI
jgi:hypothetical protein